MSKANGKPTPEQAQDTTAQEAGAASAHSGAAALVPAASADAAPRDPHHGQGGLYTRVSGQRTLTERTAHESTLSDKDAKQ